MQWFSIVCAISFIFCTYLLAWRACRNAAVAALTTGAVGFSFGVWVYAVSPDGYLPPLFLALLALVLLDPQSWQSRHETLPRALLIGATLATAAAVLLHQMYVFFALVLGFVLLLRDEFGDLRTRLQIFLIYGGGSGGLVALVYLAVHHFVAADVTFLDWARGFARDGLTTGDPPSLLSPIKGVIGAVSTMLTMNGLLAFDVIAERLTSAFATKSLLEERFTAETAIASWLRLPIMLAMLRGDPALACHGRGQCEGALAQGPRAGICRHCPAGRSDPLCSAGGHLGANQPRVLDPDLCVRDNLVPAPDIPAFETARAAAGRAGGMPLHRQFLCRPVAALGRAERLLACLQRPGHRPAR